MYKNIKCDYFSLQVYNSYSLRADSLMGEFKVPGFLSSYHLNVDTRMRLMSGWSGSVLTHSWTSVMFTMNQVSLSQTTDVCVLYIGSEDAAVGLVDVTMWKDNHLSWK